MRRLLFWLSLLETAHLRRAMRAELHGLGDHALADIGVERAAIEDYVAASCPRPERPLPRALAFAPTLQGCG